MEKKQCVYGISNSNKFGPLTDNDEDPFVTLSQLRDLPKRGKATKDKKNNGQDATETEKSQSQKPEGHRPQQSGHGGGRGGRGSRAAGERKPPKMQGPDGAASNDAKNGNVKQSAESRDQNNGRGGRGQGRGRTGPTAARAAGEKREKASGKKQPEVDCQNDTDKTDRKNGRGGRGQGRGRTGPKAAHATGEKREEASGKKQPEVDCQNDTDKTESSKAALAPKDEEPKELTLDEWKALQDQQRVKTTFNIRKGGEGVDSSQWKKGVAYQKKQDADKEEEVQKHLVESHRGQRKNVAVDMKVAFSEQERFGGRGGSRGQGGRRGGFNRHESNKTNAPEVQPPCVEDETAFPNLPGKSKQ